MPAAPWRPKNQSAAGDEVSRVISESGVVRAATGTSCAATMKARPRVSDATSAELSSPKRPGRQTPERASRRTSRTAIVASQTR